MVKTCPGGPEAGVRVIEEPGGGARLTVSGTATLAPTALFPSPLYTAEIVWNPEDHDGC